MPAARRKKIETSAVDEPVVNQENPGTSEEDRSEDSNQQEENPVAEMAPAMEVDETVENQMNPGINMVDRNPEPELVTDDAGVTRDVSKSPAPEIVDPEAEARSAEKARIRQQEGALNAAEWRDENPELTTITFIESGLTGRGHVWKAGEQLSFEEDKAEDWMLLSESEQKDRYGKVFFEKE